jgi:hypothetical protein
MTDPTRSHITMVCDHSGSMQSIRTDAEGAVNHFIIEQQKVNRPCTLSLVGFDDQYDVAYQGALSGFTSYTLTPRGMTALLDAVARAIRETGELLSALPEESRPASVFFVVQTDGQENSSRETSWTQLRDMIKHQEEAYQWTFIWLGTGPDTWNQFTRHMMGTRSVSNVVRTGAGGQSMSSGYASVDFLVQEARTGNAPQTYGGVVDDKGTFTKDEGSTEASPADDPPSA